MTLGKNFRLPLTVRPSSYRAELFVDLPQTRFEGEMQIDLRLDAATDRLHLHAVELELVHAELRPSASAAPVRPVTTTPDAESETITLAFAAPLPAGEATLTVKWRGRFSPGLRGLYRAGGIAVTQFEAADARRLFPCFDEPAFKARWALSLRDVPAGLTAISNGPVIADEPDGRGGRRIRFAETPPLSSYLVALVLGELTGSPPAHAGTIPVRTWSVPDKAHLGGFAQEIACAVLPRLEGYFGLPYEYGKVDQIGVPDFEAGAMENAGAVTYREVLLLLDPATAPLAVQKRAAEVITHELAHQWFGNLVTMVWWDDLWLNEAFATWMAYKTVDAWRPGWRLWRDFEVGKGAALALDSLRSAHAIRTEVDNAEQAGESFDAITYEKGGAVLRMVEGYLGEERFRDGIRLYMQRHRQANATADDLWGALAEASGEPVGALADSWIRQVGHPLVSVRLEGDGTLALAQRRFFSDPEAREEGEPTRWLVPIAIRFRDAEGVKTHRVLLRDAEARVALPARGPLAWCFVNAEGRGFYRTAYDPALLAKLRGALGELGAEERLGLVSDQWALVRAKVAPVGDFLDLAASLGDEPDHAVLDEVVGRLAAIEQRHLADDDRPRFQALVGSLFGPAARALGWAPAPGEDDERRLRRAAVLRALALLGRVPAAVDEAVRLYETQVPAGGLPRVDPNLLDVVVTAAARTADAARFGELRRRAATETDPATKRRYLHALARAEAPAIVPDAIALALSDDVPMQDFVSYLGGLLGNRETREAAFRLVTERWDEVHRKANSPMLLRRLVEALGALPERRHLEAVERFLAQHPIEPARQATAQTLERMRADAALRERIMPEISGWLRARGA